MGRGSGCRVCKTGQLIVKPCHAKSSYEEPGKLDLCPPNKACAALDIRPQKTFRVGDLELKLEQLLDWVEGLISFSKKGSRV